MVCRDSKNRFIRKRAGQHRALNGLQQHAEAARHAFGGQGTSKGRASQKTALRAFGEVGFEAYFQRLHELDTPHHSPPPLASEGSDSPSVVRDAGGGALRFLDCTPDWRLGPFHQYQGFGFAHVLTRSVLAVPAALRVRLPGVPLTLLPLENRAAGEDRAEIIVFLCSVIGIVVV